MIKRENWKGRYVWVSRENGKIQAWRNVKGSKLNKESATTIYKSNKTFKKDVTKKTQDLSNVKEISITKTTSYSKRKQKVSKPSSKYKTAQYVVEGTYKGQLISARSQNIRNPRSMVKSGKQAKNQAWKSFLERLAQADGRNYDEDEGADIVSKVKNLREGWVYYVPKSSKTH